MKRRDKAFWGLNSIFIRLSLTTALLIISIVFSACTSTSIEKKHFITISKGEYKTAKVTKGTIKNEFNCRGQIISTFQQKLYFKTGGGYIKSINVKQDDIVKKGDVLGECEYPELENAYKDQEESLKIAELDYESLKSKGADSYDIKMSELNIEIEKIQIAKLKDMLSERKLISNMSGIVTYVNDMKIGNPVTPYTTMFIICDTEHPLVEYTGDNSFLKVGMNAQIEYNGVMYDGKIISSSVVEKKDSIVPTTENSTLITIIGFNDKNMKMNDDVKICIELMESENTLIIPFNALHSYNNNSYVYVLEKGVKTERNVKIGLANSTDIEIKSGLKEGEEVIID